MTALEYCATSEEGKQPKCHLHPNYQCCHFSGSMHLYPMVLLFINSTLRPAIYCVPSALVHFPKTYHLAILRIKFHLPSYYAVALDNLPRYL